MISRFNSVTQAKTQTYNNNKPDNRQPSFKGPVDLVVAAGTQTLNFLNTSPAIGACFVDFFSMVLPRSLVDFTRSKDAGFETSFREGSGTVNHGLAGFVGLGAGYLTALAFNNSNGVKSHFTFTDNNALDALSEFVKNNTSTSSVIQDEQYYYDTAKNMRFFNTTGNNVEKYSQISDETASAYSKLMVKASTEKYSVQKNILKEAEALIIGETGAGSTVRLINPKNGKFVEDSLSNHIKNSFSVKKLFSDKFKNDAKELAKVLENPAYKAKVLNSLEFISKIKGLKTATAVAGLAVPLTIGMGTQPLNRYLTKKRTGSDGFVGVEGREPDKSTGFKLAKIALGLTMGSVMVSTILKKPSTLFTNPLKAAPEILSSLKFKGIVPTMNQFKFIYGMTIMSRIFAVRDKNEMRESGIKDTLGFTNWLILGGFVSKLASRGLSLNLAKKGAEGLVNYDSAKHGVVKGFKNLGKFIMNSVEKTHEEILYPALKKAGIGVIKDGKNVPFRNLIKLLAQKDAVLSKEVGLRLKYKNYAQMIGYIYSGVVLGFGIPKLNIAITNWCEKGKNKTAEQPQNDKMKISNEFVKQSAPKDNKTFGAFLSSI